MLLGTSIKKPRRVIAALLSNNYGGGGVSQLLSSSPFYAQLTKSLVLQRGTGSPTFTRATVATVMGYGPTANSGDAQVLLSCASGEARFQGARRISEGVWSDTFADGTLIPTATLKGYLAEGARTQILATADIRDMTTANWTLGATMTRARTSVGADGAANSATRLTGGAVSATNTCYTTITAAASSRTYSALVKRVTGTGPVRIVQTGTETDISSLINSSTYTMVELNASVLNVAVGFKIDTNGDAIDVDFNQFEAGAFASSRIASVGARNADVLTYPSAGNVGTDNTLYCEFNLPAGVVSTNDFIFSISTDSINRMTIYSQTATQKAAAGGLNGGVVQCDQSIVGSMAGAGTTKIAARFAANNSNMAKSGTLGINDTSCTMPAYTTISVGCRHDGAVPPFGNIKNVRIWTTALTDAQLQTITT